MWPWSFLRNNNRIARGLVWMTLENLALTMRDLAKSSKNNNTTQQATTASLSLDLQT